MAALKKNLKLLDIIAICVGAMFSSGFFILPGLAYAHTGPSVFLAYICSGIIILPAMLSQAELCTAMPKAGGTYFFLDRTFGPIVGTIGGLGSFLGLVLKTAFALVGFGAYLQLYAEVPIKAVAIGLAILFVCTNIIGAKESGKIQKILVGILVLTLTIFTVEGLRTIGLADHLNVTDRLVPFFKGGMGEFFYTISLVFVSYAGLTKVSSVAEEVENPDRNIPLGMALSLLITMIIYGLGVFVVVSLVPSAELMYDLKPIATAESYAFDWLPPSVGLLIVTAAALSAFASTGNAGILATSRYPLAMAKDKLIPKLFSRLNRFGVPDVSILFTGGLIIASILLFSEEGIAKFASAFQLIMFLLINFAVIVMRESKISTYDPGYKSPFYPWVQLFGITMSVVLLGFMGLSLILTVIGLILLCILWYNLYAAKRTLRKGAIRHWFSQLGKARFDYLEEELWDIMRSKGARPSDPMQEIVSDARILDIHEPILFDDVISMASDQLAEDISVTPEELISGFNTKATIGAIPITNELCISGLRLVHLEKPRLLIVRCFKGFQVSINDVHGDEWDDHDGRLALFIICPENRVRLHLRLMATWLNLAETETFVTACINAKSHTELRQLLYSNV
jgi:amino acid transporter